MQPHRRRASSTADARRQVQCPQRASSTGPSRLRRSVSHLVRELRGIYSNRSVVAWGAPLIRWSDDGAIILAARPIASLSDAFIHKSPPPAPPAPAPNIEHDLGK